MKQLFIIAVIILMKVAQVLGDVEPCFEGASFYTLQNSIEQAIY